MSAPTLQSPSAPAPRVYTHRQIVAIMSGLMMGMLLAALDQTIVTTALTRISEDFHRQDLYSWVVTSYLLTSTVSTPLYGKISDLFGRKHIFETAIVVFLIGSVLSGLSQNMYELIVFRGVQGLGAGGLMSLAFSIVGDVIPPRERGRYQGYFGAVFGTASVLGPLIGGFLVDQASWRWVFYVNIPIGAVALVVVNRVLQLDHQKRDAKIDVTGAVLLVVGVALFLVAVQDSGQHARISSLSLAFGLVGLLLIVAFVLWETVASEPILPLRLFRNPVFRITNALGFITGAVMFGAIIFVPQYLQYVRGVSPTVSGLRLLPLMVGMLLTSISSGRLISRLGRYKIFVISGTAILSIGLALLTLITVNTGAWALAGMVFVVGVGLGLFMQTLILATQNSIDRADMGVATSAVTFFRTLGGAIGASVLGAILLEGKNTSLAGDIARYGPTQGPLHAFTTGMSRAYLYAVPVALISVFLSFFLRELKLQATTSPTGGSSGGSAAPASELDGDRPGGPVGSPSPVAVPPLAIE